MESASKCKDVSGFGHNIKRAVPQRSNAVHDFASAGVSRLCPGPCRAGDGASNAQCDV